MAWGNETPRRPDPAVLLTGLLGAVRRYLRTGTTGDREALQHALDAYDGGDR